MTLTFELFYRICYLIFVNFPLKHLNLNFFNLVFFVFLYFSLILSLRSLQFSVHLAYSFKLFNHSWGLSLLFLLPFLSYKLLYYRLLWGLTIIRCISTQCLRVRPIRFYLSNICAVYHDFFVYVSILEFSLVPCWFVTPVSWFSFVDSEMLLNTLKWWVSGSGFLWLLPWNSSFDLGPLQLSVVFVVLCFFSPFLGF